MQITKKRFQTFSILCLLGGVGIGILSWMTWRVWAIIGAPVYETALTVAVMAVWNAVVWMIIIWPKEAE